MKLGLSFPVVQDILNVRHIAKMEETCGTLFAVMDAYSYGTDSEMYSEHQSFILGPDFVISFEEGKRNLYEQIRKVLEESLGQTRKMKSDYLFNLLINMVVDSYFEVIDILQNNLMDTEDLLMEFNSFHKETGQEIQHYRRDYSRLKKATSPLHEQFGHLLILEPELIEESTRLYFRDTYDHLQQVSVMLDANREIIASLMDLYLANNDLRMNQIMKQLTLVSTIFIPLTFLVGVWGMNFEFMPELSWKYGYLFSWLIMIVVGIIFYLWFRKKNLLR
jgi:magnesium transporter